jgi:hypothetical protein
MKIKVLISITVLVAIAALIFGYVQMSKEKAADAEADQPVTAASHVQTGSNGEIIITLDLKAQQLAGLQTATLTTVAPLSEIKAYGRVLDSATLVSLYSDITAAQASQQEYERLKKLSAQDNVSVHALEIAEAQLKHDQGAFDTAEAQLIAASGQTVLNEPADFFQSLARQKIVLVRLDTPAGETPVETPAAALLILPEIKEPLAADFIARAATTDPQVQGAGFVFAVTNPPATLAPGRTLTGLLQLPSKSAPGVIVPNNAVIRSESGDWIFIQTDETNFEQREVDLDHPMDDGWFITNNVAPDDKIVVTGAQTLLSEEHKTEIQVGD